MDFVPEPWLRGPIPGVHPFVAPVLYAFQAAREDLDRHTEGLTERQIWATPRGLGSVGFHVRHIAGSVDRLMTYLQNRQLSREQLLALEAEKGPGSGGREELLAAMDAVFAEAESIARSIDPASLAEPRAVGRKRQPSTVIGLLTHIAEHTHRHIGQAISAARLVRTLE